ncbi:MAG: hypothetical protein ACR2FN_09675 [Chitinophagaceae bacterium]
MQRFLFFLIIISFFVVISSCKKQTETPGYSLMSDYYPLNVGRTFIYKMDSTITAPFGASLFTVAFTAKDTIQSTFLDNQGRTSYRVDRFTSDSLQTQPWQYKSSYFITPTAIDIEVVDDNNYRFIKLVSPVVEGRTWKGNSYIDTKSANSPVQYLDDWNYTYQNVNAAYTVLKGTLDSTITILQQDESLPDSTFNPNNLYQERNYSIEIYAKGVGLIYKNFLHWVWQTNPQPAFQDGSYGIKLNLISYK